MIKTNYPGSPEAFTRITESLLGAGLRCRAVRSAATLSPSKMIRDSVEGRRARASAWGRNAFQRDNTRAFVHALCRVVHDKVDPEKALEQP